MLDSSLPIYPTEIRGTIRHILILKDFFLLCSRLLERYCRFGSLASRNVSRDFVKIEIQSGNDTIEILKEELADQIAINIELEKKLLDIRKELMKRAHLFNRNQLMTLESVCYKIKRRRMVMRHNEEKCIDIYYNKKELDLALPEPFECQKLKTVLEFLQELFLIQLHFHVVIIQGLNFALPLLINGLSFIDRLMYWPDQPEFGLVHKRINFTDKLRDIQVELQRLVEELVSVCLIVEAKFLYDQKLEYYFNKTVENQCAEIKSILENIQAEKEMYDLIQLEHSRITGSITKKDPGFAKNPLTIDYPIDLTRLLTPHAFWKYVYDSTPFGPDKQNAKVKRKPSEESTDQNIETLPRINPYEKVSMKKIKKSHSKPPGKTSKDKSELSDKKLLPQAKIKNINKSCSKNTFNRYSDRISETFTMPCLSSSNKDDSSIDTLLALSSTFSFKSNSSAEDFIEPKTKKSIEKIHEIIENIIDKDWSQLQSVRKDI